MRQHTRLCMCRKYRFPGTQGLGFQVGLFAQQGAIKVLPDIQEPKPLGEG